MCSALFITIWNLFAMFAIGVCFGVLCGCYLAWYLDNRKIEKLDTKEK